MQCLTAYARGGHAPSAAAHDLRIGNHGDRRTLFEVAFSFKIQGEFSYNRVVSNAKTNETSETLMTKA